MFFSWDSCMEVAMAMTQARGGRCIFWPASMMAREFLIWSLVGVRFSWSAVTATGWRSLPAGAAGVVVFAAAVVLAAVVLAVALWALVALVPAVVLCAAVVVSAWVVAL